MFLSFILVIGYLVVARYALKTVDTPDDTHTHTHIHADGTIHEDGHADEDEYTHSIPSAVTENPLDTLTQEPTVDKESEEFKQGVIDMLAEQGVDKEKLEKSYTNANGATILGDALPAKEYKSLHEAEETFGYYLGLHNTLESLTGYDLIAMHIVNNTFMQGTYENGTDKSLLVKTSKKEKSEELAKVYTEYEIFKSIDVEGVKVNLSSKDTESINLAYFDLSNGKSYALSTVSGLSEEDTLKLLRELITNLKSMEDWKE